MHHTMTVAAPARTAARRRPAVAVKSDVKTGHDIAYVTRGHASGCAGAMAYYTRSGEPPGTWEGRGTAALGLSGTVDAAVAERLYQQGVAPGGEPIIRHAALKTGEDQAAAETAALAQYREEHPFASASEINAERTRIRATSPGISRPYYDVTSSASKSVSVLHASLRVAAGQARQAGDHVTAAARQAERRNRTRNGGRMTCRRMTPEEIKQADAAYRQWWLSVLTLGLIPKPERELEAGA
jgi:TrwC relaxase